MFLFTASKLVLIFQLVALIVYHHSSFVNADDVVHVPEDTLNAYIQNLYEHEQIELNPRIVLGAGAFGEVFLGKKRTSEQPSRTEYVAIKIYPSLSSEFDNEVKALTAIDTQDFGMHQSGVFRFDRDDAPPSLFNTGCLVTNYIDGETLFKIFFRLNDRGYPKIALRPDMRANPALVVWVLRQSYAALRRIHRAGFLHGDVHLKNVMLTREDPHIVFIDFEKYTQFDPDVGLFAPCPGKTSGESCAFYVLTELRGFFQHFKTFLKNQRLENRQIEAIRRVVTSKIVEDLYKARDALPIQGEAAYARVFDKLDEHFQHLEDIAHPSVDRVDYFEETRSPTTIPFGWRDARGRLPRSGRGGGHHPQQQQHRPLRPHNHHSNRHHHHHGQNRRGGGGHQRGRGGGSSYYRSNNQFL